MLCIWQPHLKVNVVKVHMVVDGLWVVKGIARPISDGRGSTLLLLGYEIAWYPCGVTVKGSPMVCESVVFHPPR